MEHRGLSNKLNPLSLFRVIKLFTSLYNNAPPSVNVNSLRLRLFLPHLDNYEYHDLKKLMQQSLIICSSNRAAHPQNVAPVLSARKRSFKREFTSVICIDRQTQVWLPGIYLKLSFFEFSDCPFFKIFRQVDYDHWPTKKNQNNRTSIRQTYLSLNALLQMTETQNKTHKKKT